VNGHQREERDDFELVFRFEADFLFLGTFAPFFLASLRPMAIACLRLFTFRPEPLFNVPFLRFRIADSTRFDADFPYRGMESSTAICASVVLARRGGFSGRGRRCGHSGGGDSPRRSSICNVLHNMSKPLPEMVHLPAAHPSSVPEG